jgi:hypothetical protein
MIAGRKLTRTDVLFVAGCAIVYAAATFLIPPYIPLIEPDSESYLNFAPNRSALYPAFLYVCKMLRLNLIEITWLQTTIFSLALAYLLSVLLRAKIHRVLLGLLVVVLAANVLFTSFHRSILTESIYFSISIVAVGLWIDYFRTGRMLFLALAGIALGLMIGFRPAGIGLIPMQVFAAWLRRPENLSKWILVVLAIVPVGIGAGSERLLYRVVHSGPAQSTAPLLLMGKAAMLIKPNMTFTGPHARALNSLGAHLFALFGPVQKNLVHAPSIAVRVQLSAAYEGLAQDKGFLLNEISEAADQEHVSIDDLRSDLGEQVILQNISGYIIHTLLNEIGQWSVDAQHFPPTARLIAEYADTNPAVSFGGRIPHELLHPQPLPSAMIIYPAFLLAGAVTFVLAIGFFVFVVRPGLMVSPAGFYLGIATFLSAMCHAYTLFISLANEWTPRFLMAVFPHLEIIALCVLMFVAHRWKKATSKSTNLSDSYPCHVAAASRHFC